MTGGLILIILVLSLVLIKSADMVIVGLRRIAKQSHTKVFALSAIVLALGTSFPELFVGITSALEKTPNLSLGVVIGSNIANIALIGGLTAIISGKIRVYSEELGHEVWIAFAAGALPIFLASDRHLNRVDALILIAVYLAYATGFFRKRYVQIGKEQQEEQGFVYRFVRRFNHIDSAQRKEFGRLFIGIALLLASADGIVKFASILASEAGIPIFVVGLVVLAIGTSLPELAFSLRSILDHEPSMFFGNLLGSTIANSTLVVGTVALISPIEIFAFDDYLLAVAAFIFVFSWFWIFVRSKNRLDRWEGVMLLFIYITFLVLEFN